MSGLTNKQAAFVREYFTDFNATQAAKRAGYGGNDSTLGATGSRLLKNDKVAARIGQCLRESAMLADEVLARLAEIARGGYAEYITVAGDIDFVRLIADDKAYLIKGIRDTKYGKNIEFYDAQRALVDIGRHYQLFTDGVDITTDGQSLGRSFEEAARIIYGNEKDDTPGKDDDGGKESGLSSRPGA
jgi:phage terminase small subunit